MGFCLSTDTKPLISFHRTYITWEWHHLELTEITECICFSHIPNFLCPVAVLRTQSWVKNIFLVHLKSLSPFPWLSNTLNSRIRCLIVRLFSLWPNVAKSKKNLLKIVLKKTSWQMVEKKKKNPKPTKNTE